MRTQLRRATWLAGVLMLALCCGGARAGEMDPQAVVDIATAFANAKTQQGMDAAYDQLVDADRAAMRQAVRQLVADPARRTRALQLAAAFRLEGLLPDLRPLIDTEDQDLVLRALLGSPDREAHGFVLERFLSSEPSSPAAQAAARALQSCGLITTDWVARIKAEVAKPPSQRQVDAFRVARFQLGSAAENPAQLLADWPRAEAEYRKNTRPRPREGTLLSDLINPRSSGVVRCGTHIIIEPEGVLLISPLPEELQRTNWRLQAWVRIVPTEPAGERGGTRVLLVSNSWKSGAGLDAREGLWHAVFAWQEADVTPRVLPIKSGEWTLFEWRWSDMEPVGRGDKSVAYDRLVDVVAGNSALVKRATLPGRLLGLRINSGPRQRVVVGSVAYARAK